MHAAPLDPNTLLSLSADPATSLDHAVTHMPLDPNNWTRTRSALANALKADPNADVTELRRQLKAERVAGYVTNAAESAPMLTREQCDRLAALLRPATHAGGGGSA